MQKAQQAATEPFDAGDWQIGIVVAQFNRHITTQLYESALKRAEDYKIPVSKIRTIQVAGSMEIPLALQAMAASNKYQALLAVGCVIRGETPHFDYVCKLVTEGILRVQLDNNIPVGFGVLTCDNEQQALERASLGADHLDAVMHLAKAIKKP